MYELYLNHHGGDGSAAEVWIDHSAGLVKKLYKLDGITIASKPPVPTTIEKITELYQSDVYWTEVLKSEYVLPTIEHGPIQDQPGYYVIQPYIGPDLLQYYVAGSLHTEFPDIVDQLIEMFCLFKEHNIHKINNAMSNLTGSNGKIVAFDFKYTHARSAHSRPMELASITKWLCKIDDRLYTLLEDLV